MVIVKRNPTPRRPENDGSARRGDEEAGKEARPGSRKEGSSSPRSDAGAQGCQQRDARREPLRVVIYPFHGPNEGIDIADALLDTIAMILWKLQGGNEPVNRLEASVLLERAMRPQVNESGG